MAGEQILIVDDMPVTRELVKILLAKQGYQVLSARDAEEALETVRSHRPRLVLTDIQLPGMNGLELARRIKSDIGTRDIPVIAMSAFARPVDQEEALEAGCDGCIAKPFDALTLAAKIGKFLDSRHAAPRDRPGAVPARDAAASTSAQNAPLQPSPLPDLSLGRLRTRFFEEAYAHVTRWRDEIDRRFDPAPVAQMVHQWIGTAGLLGDLEISERARALQTALRARPIDTGELREALDAALAALATRLTGGQ